MSAPNPDQKSPGYEKADVPIEVPYSGPAVHDHMGVMTLNQAFAMGAEYGRYDG